MVPNTLCVPLCVPQCPLCFKSFLNTEVSKGITEVTEEGSLQVIWIINCRLILDFQHRFIIFVTIEYMANFNTFIRQFELYYLNINYLPAGIYFMKITMNSIPVDIKKVIKF
jgi:hypothetical protein